MTDEELRDVLDGLHAYDDGAADSGIRDEARRARCIAVLKDRRTGAEGRQWLARLVRDMWLTDEAIEQGYGLEDALGFIERLEDRMDCPVR